MIITCPHCSARYRVKDELIQAKGKRVKCKKCTAVFVAYRDRDAVLEHAPAAATIPVQQVRPAAAPAQAKPAGEPPQATVKVDRSHLDKFLRDQGAPPVKGNSLDGTQSTLKVDPAQFRQYMEEQQGRPPEPDGMAAGATVQVDRSQIDAFLKAGNSPAPAKPAQPSASETVQIDPAALSNLVQGGIPPEMETPAPPTPVDPPAFANEPTVTDAATTQADSVEAAPPDLGPLDKPAAAPSEPAFPSDEELGINHEQERVPEAFEAPPAPVFSEPAAPSPPPPQAEPAETLFKAEVDGKVYPNLRLDALERWVREGRLLESDRLAPNGSEDYQPAGQYPELEVFFQQWAAASEQEEPPKKKGFFARLFSFGK